ncbi:hypothetical protein Q4E40_19765 [Pontibacter sp. BT731]|uniref:hypothetical protein n=1 Tax=Pontibacter coccineus TaxID=3063328 RepID=UPI0026E18213|nr:hypothetical protein [Pontibacter sp. BT731]MDO6392382.1 hypothetical protein [Pontibacter sp. BT731]
MKYRFCTEQFGISDSGIHLLRSRYNYKSVASADVTSVVIRRGKAIKNWLFLLLFGVACLGFSAYYTSIIYDFFYSEEGGRIYIEEIVVPVIPAFAGIAAITVALRNTTIAIVQYRGGKLVLDLSDLVKSGEATSFVLYLNETVGREKIRHSIALEDKLVTYA